MSQKLLPLTKIIINYSMAQLDSRRARYTSASSWQSVWGFFPRRVCRRKIFWSGSNFWDILYMWRMTANEKNERKRWYLHKLAQNMQKQTGDNTLTCALIELKMYCICNKINIWFTYLFVWNNQREQKKLIN